MENYKAKLTLTEESNIDSGRRKVKDESKVFYKIFNWTDIIDVYDVVNNKVDKIKISSLSLFDNLVILDGKKYKILRMYSSDSLKE